MEASGSREDRTSALRVLAKWMFGKRDEEELEEEEEKKKKEEEEEKKKKEEEEEEKMEEEEEKMEEEEEEEGDRDFCANILSSFIHSLETQQWESLRERMRAPLTQAHLVQVSRRIIMVVSELVCQVLVPALMVHLQAQYCSEAPAGQEEEERSSLPTEKPAEEDVTEEDVAEEDVAEEGVADEDVAEEGVAEEGVAEEDVAEEGVAEEGVAEEGVAEEGVAEASPWDDVEHYLDPATQKMVYVIAQSLDDSSWESTEAGEKSECAACRILKSLACKMRSTRKEEAREEEENGSDVDSVDSMDGFGGCSGGCSLHEKLEKVRGVFKRRHGSPVRDTAPTYPLTVSSEQVARDLSSHRFRDACLGVLKKFLMNSLVKFSIYFCKKVAYLPQPSAVACEMLDIVVATVKKMCQSPARKVSFPWQRSENTTVSEEQVTSTASRLKVYLRETLRFFLKSCKEASDRLSEEEKSSGSLSDESGEDSEGGADNNMASVVQSLLDQTEPLLRQDHGGVDGEAALLGLEELIRQDKLYAISELLADKFPGMFHRRARGPSRPLAPGRRSWSDSELSQPARNRVGVVPTDQVHAFIEEAVRRLLTSLISPPPSWGMGHTIQVQSTTAGPSTAGSSTSDRAASGEKFEAVMDLYSKLMADQVMGNLGGRQQEVTERERKKTAVLFFQELPNNIMRSWINLTNKPF
ncbi:uncharacterized protein LOC117732624 [Cyclopterus lumpus]|uniref:uncharacterized protein LOC117732624 n=1 Tax=Cyclopterus lumpus TaxID=8103 RepID=UPI001486F85E|nr:uncharacterized protein LOC117732624 [Cyclopterus lumpus]